MIFFHQDVLEFVAHMHPFKILTARSPMNFSKFFLVFRNEKKQTSKDVELTKGLAYLLTVLFKEHEGKDHVSVGVKYPNGDVEKPMSAKNLYLSKFTSFCLRICLLGI